MRNHRAMEKLLCGCRSNRMGSIAGSILLACLSLNQPIPVAAAESPKPTDSIAQSSPSKLDQSARRIHARINEFRASQGLKALRIDPFLSKLAAEHSRDMAQGKVDVGHQGFEKRAKAIQGKIQYRSIAENVGASMGQSEPEKEVVRGWLNSPEHLKNIKGDFDLTGIGVSGKGKEEYYFTQIFLKKLE